MEEEPDRPREDLVDKFERLVSEKRVENIIVYWPAKAKMQTTYDELILLRARVGRAKIPTIWILHHVAVARITRGTFAILERGGRSRYLDSVARLGVIAIAWDDEQGLRALVERLASEL